MVALAVSRWININLAVSMEPAERRTLVKTAELLLKHMKNVPNSTELKCRLSWIIVQSRIDAKDYESASKLLDKARFVVLLAPLSDGAIERVPNLDDFKVNLCLGSDEYAKDRV